MNLHDWITIAHAVGDLLYLVAAIITLITILANRRQR
jgi:hypothetical protein